MATDCKSVVRRTTEVRILPCPLNIYLRAGVTQLVESQPSKLLVASSSLVSRSFSRATFAASSDYYGCRSHRRNAADAGCGNSSVGRASASQAECRGFESRFPLANQDKVADVAQLVEHFLGKEEVTGSIPVISSHSF